MAPSKLQPVHWCHQMVRYAVNFHAGRYVRGRDQRQITIARVVAQIQRHFRGLRRKGRIAIDADRFDEPKREIRGKEPYSVPFPSPSAGGAS